MEKKNISDLPQVAVDYIDSVIKHMKYRKKVRTEVKEELTAHFNDALAGCQTDEEKQNLTEELIAAFGDVKLLGKLLRRAKKRCRPLWRTVVARIFQFIGIFILLCLLRIGYMAAGRPVISVDYTQWMNDKVCSGRDESLNAWHDYQRAIELLHKDMPPEIKKIDNYSRDQHKTQEDWKSIESFLETESESFETFRVGSQKPYYWNIYQPPKDEKREIVNEVVQNLMPQMSGYRKIAQRMAMFQIPFDIHRGYIKQAVNDSIALYHFGLHVLSQGVVIEQLVGISIKSVAIHAINDLLNQVELSASDLLRLQQIIEKDYDPNIAPMDWSLEKAFWYDQIQRSFTDDGQGNGRPLPKGPILAIDNVADYAKGFAFGFPDRKEVVEMYDNLFDEYEKSRMITPWQAYLDKIPTLLIPIKGVFVQKVSAAAIQKTVTISWRVRVG